MMNIHQGAPCAPEEIIVRAIHTGHYDEVTGILRYKLFAGRNVSVSRVSVLTIEELYLIFTNDIDNPPSQYVIQVGNIRVDELMNLAKNYAHPVTKQTIHLSVIQDPCPVQKEYKQYPILSFSEPCTCPHNSSQYHCPEHSGKAEKPCPRNYAHAEIRGDKISDGFANIIGKYLEANNRLHTYPEREQYVPKKAS